MLVHIEHIEVRKTIISFFCDCSIICDKYIYTNMQLISIIYIKRRNKKFKGNSYRFSALAM